MQLRRGLNLPVCLILFLLQFGAVRTVSAQQTINYASVSGRVTDPTDAVVSGAQITVRQTETNFSSTTSTDQEGRFRFPYLKPGPYVITVRVSGFAEITRALTLTVGAAFELPVALNLAAVATEVNVSG